ncbi:MAG: hypothetical protein ACREPC_12990, partial [Stenotrophomonas sp.]
MASIKPPEREHMTLDWPSTGQGPAAPPPPVIGRHRWMLGAGDFRLMTGPKLRSGALLLPAQLHTDLAADVAVAIA